MWALFLQRLDLATRWLIPFLSALFLLLLSVVPLPLPYFGSVMPALGVMAVYYWAVHRPDLFRPAGAFVLGLVQDALHGYPFGTSALLFVVLHHVALNQRRYFVGHAFFMLWIGFALAMMGVSAGTWLVLSLWYWHFMPLLPLALQTVVTITLFPVPALLLNRLQRYLLSQSA